MRTLAALVLAAGVLSACGGGEGGGGVRTIVLDVHHSSFSESAITVRAGETVRFVIRNRDPIPHELIVGDETVQDRHEHGTESHHAARAGEVSVPAGATAETAYTFTQAGHGVRATQAGHGVWATQAGHGERILFGCHLPGHWAYGMRGEIRVV